MEEFNKNKIMNNKEDVKNNLEYKLEVPYYSQYLDIPNDTLKAVRACGITCVKMCLDYFDKNSDPLLKLVEDGMKVDENGKTGFGPSGWYHDYFLEVFEKNNLKSERWAKIDEEKKLRQDNSLNEEEILNILDQKEKECFSKIVENITKENPSPSIVSVERRIFNENIFHMVLIIGIKKDKDKNIEGLYIHDPAKLVRIEEGKFISIDDFMEYWRKMAIFVSE